MTNRVVTGDFGRTDAGLPSGMEVESARAHVPMQIGAGMDERHLLSDHTHDGGLKDRIHHLRNRATESLTSARRQVAGRVTSLRGTTRDRVSSLRGTAHDRVVSLRSGARGGITRIESDMRANPAKWAGIAAGAGLGLGILGRIIRNRSRNASLPRLVIIDQTC